MIMHPRGDKEQGSAVIIVVILLAASLVMSGVVAAVGRLAATRVKASTAADLAALAAAGGRDCVRAGSVAAANGAVLTDCHWQGQDVSVQVEVPVEVGGREVLITAASRAGPP